jgi:hypothetical protein
LRHDLRRRTWPRAHERGRDGGDPKKLHLRHTLRRRVKIPP